MEKIAFFDACQKIGKKAMDSGEDEDVRDEAFCTLALYNSGGDRDQKIPPPKRHSFSFLSLFLRRFISGLEKRGLLFF